MSSELIGEFGVDVKWWMDKQMELFGPWFSVAEGLTSCVPSGSLQLKEKT